MFADRLGSGSPGVGQRSYSPANRRPSPLSGGPPRPPPNPRSTSLAAISRINSSTDSLPRANRGPNGSHLRQEVPYFENPLEVLEKIVGTPLPIQKDGDIDQDAKRPEEPLKKIDFGGLSLEEFAARSPKATRRARAQSIKTAEEYESESAKFEDLHKSILGCDGVLKSVETSLEGFQRDLAAVSSEIEVLQNRSTALNTKLENRKVVEKLLGPAVEDVAISPWVVKTIADSPINETWSKALAELQKRIKAVETRSKNIEDGKPQKALTDVKPLLDNLSARASEKIRDYVVTQIKAFRSPSINAQIIQQQNLSKYRDLYSFLAQNQPKLAGELAQAYVNTLRWYYTTHFERYKTALSKLGLVQIDSTHTLAADPTQPKPKSSVTGQPTNFDAFTLGRRADILKNAMAPALSAYVADEDKSAHPLEVHFRSFNTALLDNVAAEYAFMSHFFASLPAPTVLKHCADVFAPSFALGQSYTTELISSSHDCLGLLLAVRLAQRFALELQRRRVPAAEAYTNRLGIALWPRFQLAMDGHTASVAALAASLSGKAPGSSAASKLAFSGGSGSGASDPSKASVAPHFLTQRFAQLLYGILAVSADAGDDEPVARSLDRLRGEFESFLQKASRQAGAERKQRQRFVGNNVALVRAIIADAEGRLADGIKAHFDDVERSLKG